MRQLIAALVVLLFAPSCVPADPSERDRVSCYARFYAEDYQAALAPCQRSAEHGHAVGKYLLGLMYAQGLAVPKEESRGVDLMRAAAEMGYSDAQKDYGIALQNGVGVPQNASEACSWVGEIRTPEQLSRAAVRSGLLLDWPRCRAGLIQRVCISIACA